MLQANTGFPSSRRSARVPEPVNRVLEVQDYGGTQQVAIQQGDTTTVIQQDPNSKRPKLEVYDKEGVHTASKYKPLDTPGISVTKGGTHNTNTVVEVGEGDTKQSIELLKKPGTVVHNATAADTAADVPKAVADKASLVAGAAAAAADSTKGKLNKAAAAGSGSATAKDSKASAATSGKARSSFHGGGTTEDSAASSNVTERASQDQKQAMAATDRQKSSSAGEISSSSSDEAHPKDPASRQADNGLSGPLSSVGMAAAAVASGVKSLVSNSTEVCSSSAHKLAFHFRT